MWSAATLLGAAVLALVASRAAAQAPGLLEGPEATRPSLPPFEPAPRQPGVVLPEVVVPRLPDTAGLSGGLRVRLRGVRFEGASTARGRPMSRWARRRGHSWGGVRADRPSGQPGGRLASRLGGEPRPIALVPERVGLTLEAQPTLYWFLAKPSPQPLRVRVNDTDALKPLLSTTVEAGTAGLHALSPGERGVRPG